MGCGLFQDAEEFQKFLDGDDYSYGLSDVPDAEFDAHYEAIVSAIKDMVAIGTIVDLPTVPHVFLREAGFSMEPAFCSAAPDYQLGD